MAMKKKSASKKTTAKKGRGVRRNDPLRRKLEGVIRAIEQAHPTTRRFEEIRNLNDPLNSAIQKLKENPGPVPVISG